MIVGPGWSGNTVSKCIRMLSDQRIDFTLIEPNPALVPCPVVNLVLCAHRQLADITIGYDNLVARQCVRRVCGRAASVEPTRKQVKLEDGSTLRYGKLLLAHGVDMTGDGVEGLQAAQAEGRTLHRWKADAGTLALQRQFQAMREGGTDANVIRKAPCRCPPGPYECASVSLVAACFSNARSGARRC